MCFSDYLSRVKLEESLRMNSLIVKENARLKVERTNILNDFNKATSEKYGFLFLSAESRIAV